MQPKLSATQAQILTAAAVHEAQLATAPLVLPAAARNAVFHSILKAGLLEEQPAPAEYRGLAWRQAGDGTPIVLRLTERGLHAIGVEPKVEAPEAAGAAAPAAVHGTAQQQATGPAHDGSEAPVQPPLPPLQRASLHEAAAAVLAAWDAPGSGHAGLPLAEDLSEPMERLRSLLARRRSPGRPLAAGAARVPREGTKQEAVLTLLRRAEGATVAQVMEATGWAQHTVRGFFAGLKKKGHMVKVQERVRQVGPGAQGAKGSYSVYHIAGEQG
jgi:hypothetical protein